MTIGFRDYHTTLFLIAQNRQKLENEKVILNLNRIFIYRIFERKSCSIVVEDLNVVRSRI